MLIVLLLLFFPFTQCADSELESKVDYLEKLIEEETEKAKTFVLPTDARMYEPKVKNAPAKVYGEYDFVIVGGGATGAVIANRLSEVRKWKIILLEAGKFGNDFTDIPAYLFSTVSSGYNWGYKTVPQETACLASIDKTCVMMEGKGVGGSSLMSGLIYGRGHPTDYNTWVALGNPGWSYKDVLPYFKKSEDFHKTDKDATVNERFHGTGGYLSVEYNTPRIVQTDEFLDANKELGYHPTDYNSPWQVGASPTQMNTKHGRRADSGNSFIKPILGRNNLEVLTNSYVVKIRSEGERVVGVHFSHNRTIYEVRVRKEAIVSAGAYGSPQILMLSGIGPVKHLEEIGIPLKKDLEVGSKLLQHSVYFGLTFSSNLSAPNRPLREYIKDYLKGRGPLANTDPSAAVGFYHTSFGKTPNYPDLELLFLPPNSTSTVDGWLSLVGPEVYNSVWGGTDVSSSFLIYPVNLQQKSIGTVRLNSSFPYEYPMIDPNFLSDTENHDKNVLYEGIKLALELVKTKSFQKINAKLQIKPLPACRNYKAFTKDYWFCTLRYLTYDFGHPMGTCPMGPDAKRGAVVNHQLKVYGFSNLRVAGASVFPLALAGQTGATCVMIGEKVSDLIKCDNL
ncbi:hypothetical protein JTB14_013538 [Gonioctena quinquepunctata]|nr:hypothetical protein JTB14_013538 [Gonioctena quinquepunctata]